MMTTLPDAGAQAAPHAPSGWSIERSVAAWQQIRAALDADPALAVDEAVIAAALVDAEITHPLTLLSRLIDAVVWAERREEEARELSRRIAERAARYESRKDMLRLSIHDLLTALDVKSHRAPLGLALIMAGRASVVITDAEALADQYV